MRLFGILALASILLFYTGTASAEETLLDTGTRYLESTRPAENPAFRERVKGAQDQFLQHQAQVRERATEMKDNAAARVEAIRTNVLERRETAREGVAELQGTDPEDRGALMRARMEERKALLTEKRAAFASSTAERRALFAEKRSELTAERFDHAVRLMNAMVLRLSGLADRIEARIGALRADGIETDAAERALNAARDSVADAEASVSELADAIAAALASETPRESLAESRTLAARTKEAIRAAYGALKAAAAALPRTSSESGT